MSSSVSFDGFAVGDMICARRQNQYEEFFDDSADFDGPNLILDFKAARSGGIIFQILLPSGEIFEDYFESKEWTKYK